MPGRKLEVQRALHLSQDVSHCNDASRMGPRVALILAEDPNGNRKSCDIK